MRVKENKEQIQVSPGFLTEVPEEMVKNHVGNLKLRVRFLFLFLRGWGRLLYIMIPPELWG